MIIATVPVYFSRDEVYATFLEYETLICQVVMRMLDPMDNIWTESFVSAARERVLHDLFKFDLGAGVPVRSYIISSTRHGVLDEMREVDTLSRTHRKSVKAGLEPAFIYLPLDAPLSEGDDSSLLCDVIQDHFVVLPDKQCELNDLYAIVLNILREICTEHEQKIFHLYYTNDLKQKDIAIIVGVTEPRICQIINSIRAKIREKFLERMGSEF